MNVTGVQIDIEKLVHVLHQCLNKTSRLVTKEDSTEKHNITDNAISLERFVASFKLFIDYTRKRMEAECTPHRADCGTPTCQSWGEEQDSKRELQELKRKLEVIKEKYEKEEENKRQLKAEYKKAIEMIEVNKNEELNEIGEYWVSWVLSKLSTE